MHIPPEINLLSPFAADEQPMGPYPSLGFLPLFDAELGNGDYFGLYWPLGRETEAPIVCDMWHDEAKLVPAFSGAGKFVAWLEANDWERGDEEPQDADFAPMLVQSAKAFFRGAEKGPAKQDDIEAGIVLLQQACEQLPEVGDYWFALASQLRRLGRNELAAHAALRAFHSNWAFGIPSDGVMRMLSQVQLQTYLEDDPFIRRLDGFKPGFGGEKHNDNYPIMLAASREYLEAGQVLPGLMLYQNYAYSMYFETQAFQERYGFELTRWQSEFSALCLTHLGDDRRVRLSHETAWKP